MFHNSSIFIHIVIKISYFVQNKYYSISFYTHIIEKIENKWKILFILMLFILCKKLNISWIIANPFTYMPWTKKLKYNPRNNII